MIDKIELAFYKEFCFIKDKFRLIPLTINKAETSEEEFVYHPGVYVFWKDENIIKVGRHLTNSRKRALEHIRDNTRNEKFQMNQLSEDNCNCGLVLINCKNPEDYHWSAAIEIFLEKVLNPVIKSKRTG